MSGANKKSFMDELAESRAQSASVTEARKRVRRVRGCSACDCFWFVYTVRVLSAFTGLGVSTISVFGFFMADNLFSRGSERVPGLYGTTFAEFGVFIGIVSVYFVAFGLLIVAAELRVASVKETVLAHVSFLSTFIGRAAFYLLLGTLLLLPGHVGSRIVGGFLLASGVFQLLISVLVSKDVMSLAEVEDDLTSVFSKGDAPAQGQKTTRRNTGVEVVGSSKQVDVSWAEGGRRDTKRADSTVSTPNPMTSGGKTNSPAQGGSGATAPSSVLQAGGAGEGKAASGDNPFLALQ